MAERLVLAFLLLLVLWAGPSLAQDNTTVVSKNSAWFDLMTAPVEQAMDEDGPWCGEREHMPEGATVVDADLNDTEHPELVCWALGSKGETMFAGAN